MKTPIYSTGKCHAVQSKRQRRRIGQMSAELKNELKAMPLFERTRMGIAVSMAMVTLLNR